MGLLISRKKLNEQKGGVDNIYGIKGKSAPGRAEQAYFGDDEGAIRHSRYYHDYFRGYAEVRVEDPGNRFKPYKIQRVYTSPWIVADMERRAYAGRCLTYVLLTLACAVLFVMALTDRAVTGNYSPVVAVPGFLGAVTVMLLVIRTAGYLLRPRKMTLYDHSSSTKHLKRTSLAAGALCGLTALVSFIFALAAGPLGRSLLTAGELAAASAAAFGVWALERNMAYREEKNDTRLPKGEAHRIQ